MWNWKLLRRKMENVEYLWSGDQSPWLDSIPGANRFWGARGSVVVKALLQTGRSQVRYPMAALGPGVYSASNRNEYQKH
jgi:hypothetical protein